jgi:hypothetical protein
LRCPLPGSGKYGTALQASIVLNRKLQGKKKPHSWECGFKIFHQRVEFFLNRVIDFELNNSFQGGLGFRNGLFLDLGFRFFRWTGRSLQGYRWLFQRDCGTELSMDGRRLSKGYTEKSFGWIFGFRFFFWKSDSGFQ